MGIDSFEYEERSGELGDLYYTIKLYEWKDISPKRIVLPVKKEEPAKTQEPARAGKPEQTSKTYTVKPGDCLWNIAKKFYGKGSDYTKIYNANKGKIGSNPKIDTITIHCVVGQCSVETLGNVFAPTSRQASSNYGVGVDGRIGMYVEEKDRSWCSSSGANDHRAITIEVASDTKHPYAVNGKAFAALIDLVTDICQRNGIKKLVWSTNKADRVNHRNGCNMTVHRDYANKSCPGDYLYNRHGQIADEVNKRLGSYQEPVVEKDDQAEEKALAVGMEVDFTGTSHYTSAYKTATRKTCKAGKAKITAIAAGKAHPYHLVAVSGRGSTVYGWVDAADISAGADQTIRKGDKVKVLKAQTYNGGTFKTYYDVYDVIQVNGDRVVIGIGKTVTAAVKASNLQKV